MQRERVRVAPFQRLLVVDDNASIHDDFRKVLGAPVHSTQRLADLESALFGAEAPASPRRGNGSLPFALTFAHQGEEAIELVSREIGAGRSYSVAFVDMRMPPGIDGLETIRRLWDVDPRIHAVICTAYTDHSYREIVRTLGSTDQLLILRKPFDAIEVQQLAHALTMKWELCRQVENRLACLEQLVAGRTHELESANQELAREAQQRLDAEARLQHLATHDTLTGIPNRLLMQERALESLARARRHQQYAGVVLLDLDHFKDINDTHGHDTGDELLRQTAGRLQDCVRTNDVVARMGGDEFVLVLENLQTPDESAAVAERVAHAFASPFLIRDQQLHSRASLGIALFPTDGDDFETLLKCADLAMYQAKQRGRATHCYYSSAMLEGSRERLVLRQELERALAHGLLEVHYQPLVDLRSGMISSFEALVRWFHPELGNLPPSKFIPIAESTGLIGRLGEWVLSTACEQLAHWHALGNRQLALAVNVSARQLHRGDFASVVQSTLERWQLEPQWLDLELTESAVMRDYERARASLEHLDRLGVRLTIDDFGSGYSSLLRLKSTPFRQLKVDRSFIRDIANDERSAVIVKSIITMAHGMGLTVVAEGVEVEEQLHALRSLEWGTIADPFCDTIQGFAVSRALPAQQATRLLGSATLPPFHLPPSRSSLPSH